MDRKYSGGGKKPPFEEHHSDSDSAGGGGKKPSSEEHRADPDSAGASGSLRFTSASKEVSGHASSGADFVLNVRHFFFRGGSHCFATEAGTDLVSFSAIVTDTKAWNSLTYVKRGSMIQKTNKDGSKQIRWTVTGRAPRDRLAELSYLPFIQNLDAARQIGVVVPGGLSDAHHSLATNFFEQEARQRKPKDLVGITQQTDPSGNDNSGASL